MDEYEIGDQVAYQKLCENIVDWAEGGGTDDFEEYLQILMDAEDSEAAVFYDLQVIGLELGHQAGEDAPADTLYQRVLDADPTADDAVFGLPKEHAKTAFYDMGYDAAVQMNKYDN